jgi:hypothetical protein
VKNKEKAIAEMKRSAEHDFPAATSTLARNTKNGSLLESDAVVTFSLKRMCLSTSPGELRLATDLQGLEGWSYMGREAYLYFRHDASGATLERDAVDPHRLRLTLPEAYTFWIQVPRMYPHAPPRVYRVEPSHHHHGGNHSHNTHPTLSPSSHQVSRYLGAAAVARAGLAGRAGPPLLQRVEVLSRPPAHSCESHEEAKKLTSTHTYDEWSPIRRLSDLLDHLLDLPRSRHAAWRLEQQTTGQPQGHYPLHEDPKHLLESSVELPTTSSCKYCSSLPHDDICMSGEKRHSPPLHQQLHADEPAQKLGFDLWPNRFNVGYSTNPSNTSSSRMDHSNESPPPFSNDSHYWIASTNTTSNTKQPPSTPHLQPHHPQSVDHHSNAFRTSNPMDMMMME